MRASGDLFQVGTANPTGVDLDQEFTGTDLWDGQGIGQEISANVARVLNLSAP